MEGLVDKVSELMYILIGMGDIEGLLDKVNELICFL